MSWSGNGTPLQYSCLENPMDGGAWWAAVHGVAKSRTRLSDFTFTFSLSHIGEGNGNSLQCSCLENPREGRAWWAAVYGVTQSRTELKRLSSSSSRGLRNILNKTEFFIPLYSQRVSLFPKGFFIPKGFHSQLPPHLCPSPKESLLQDFGMNSLAMSS